MAAKIQLVDTNKYERDPHSKAILASDVRGLAAYKANKEKMRKIESYGEDINSLREEMQSIKDLLMQILDNQGRGE